MKLHENQTEFRELITLTARDKHISESAVERDYYIVRALKQLADSEEVDSCVFKGGTSLSKCYPGSIERFSEDIDLTFYKTEGLSNKQIERRLKAVEKIMTAGAKTEPKPTQQEFFRPSQAWAQSLCQSIFFLKVKKLPLSGEALLFQV